MKKQFKKLLSILMAFCMVMGMVPVQAFAAGETELNAIQHIMFFEFGVNPDYDVLDQTKYTSQVTKITDAYGNTIPESDTLKPGNHTVYAEFKAAEGYVFADDVTIYLIDGHIVSSSKIIISNDKKTITAWESANIKLPFGYSTVDFYTDGGTAIDPQYIQNGKTVTKPADPTKEGYVFKGWYDNGTEYNFSTKVTGNLTLIARWEAEPATETINVTYDYESKEDVVKQFAKGVSLYNAAVESAPPADTKSGYVFHQWNLSADTPLENLSEPENPSRTKLIGDVTFVPHWYKYYDEIHFSFSGYEIGANIADGVLTDDIDGYAPQVFPALWGGKNFVIVADKDGIPDMTDPSTMLKVVTGAFEVNKDYWLAVMIGGEGRDITGDIELGAYDINDYFLDSPDCVDKYHYGEGEAEIAFFKLKPLAEPTPSPSPSPSPTPTPEIWVGGIGMADGDYLAEGASATTTTAQTDNYAYYEDGVLTLHNYDYSGNGKVYSTSGSVANSALIYTNGNLDILLIGNNTFTSTDSEDVFVTAAYGNSISLYGSGNFTADVNGNGFFANNNCYIYGSGNKISLNTDDWGIIANRAASGLTSVYIYNCTLEIDSIGSAIYTNDVVSISGSNVNLETALDSDSNGDGIITSTYYVKIEDGSNVVINAAGNGIYSNGYNQYVTVDESILDITAVKDGIRAPGEIEITDSTGTIVSLTDTMEEDGDYCALNAPSITLPSDMSVKASLKPDGSNPEDYSSIYNDYYDWIKIGVFEEVTPITTIEIDGVSAPQPNQTGEAFWNKYNTELTDGTITINEKTYVDSKFDNIIVVDGEFYHADKETAVDDSHVIAPGTYYNALALSPVEGFKFAEDITATVYGATATETELLENGILVIYAKYVLEAPAPAQPTVALNESAITLTVGGTETLVPTITPADFVCGIEWSTSDDKVATVDSDGKVTAVAPGTATVTVTLNPNNVPRSTETTAYPTATCLVTVLPADVPQEPTTSVTVKKVWNVPETFDRADLPESVEVYLLADGQEVTDSRVSLDAGNQWTYTWTELPVAMEDGTSIVYTVDEVKVEGYEKIVEKADATTGIGFTITNTLVEEDDKENEEEGGNGGATTPTTPSAPSTPSVPDTSDNTNTLMYLTSLICAAAALVAVVIYRRKRSAE